MRASSNRSTSASFGVGRQPDPHPAAVAEPEVPGALDGVEAAGRGVDLAGGQRVPDLLGVAAVDGEQQGRRAGGRVAVDGHPGHPAQRRLEPGLAAPSRAPCDRGHARDEAVPPVRGLVADAREGGRGSRQPPSSRPAARTAASPARTARARPRSRAAACRDGSSRAARGPPPRRRSAARGTCTASTPRSRRRARPCRPRRAPSRGRRRPSTGRRPRGPGRRSGGRAGRVPMRFDAAVIATSRVRSASDRRDVVDLERRPVAGSKSTQRTVAPAASAAWTHGRMFASWSSRVTTTSSPGPHALGQGAGEVVGQRRGAPPEDHPARLDAEQVAPWRRGRPRRSPRPGARPSSPCRGWRPPRRGVSRTASATTSGPGSRRARRSARRPRRSAGKCDRTQATS